MSEKRYSNLLINSEQVCSKPADSLQSTLYPSLDEKADFFTAAFQAWLATSDYLEFYKLLKVVFPEVSEPHWNKFAGYFYERTKDLNKRQKFYINAAQVASDGVKHLFESLTTAWLETGPANFKVYLKHVQDHMGNDWQDSFEERVGLFYSVVIKQEEIFQGSKSLFRHHSGLRNQVVMTMQKTVFLILKNSEQMADYLIFLLDNYFTGNLEVAKFLPSPVVDSANYVAENLKSNIVYVVDSSLYRYLDSKLNITDLASHFIQAYAYITTLTFNKLMASELPIHIQAKLEATLSWLGLQNISALLERYFWELLDRDKDGVVTLGDLYFTVDKFNPWKALYYFLIQYDQDIHEALRTPRRRRQLTNN